MEFPTNPTRIWGRDLPDLNFYVPAVLPENPRETRASPYFAVMAYGISKFCASGKSRPHHLISISRGASRSRLRHAGQRAQLLYRIEAPKEAMQLEQIQGRAPRCRRNTLPS